MKNVLILGLGYVGLPTAVVAAQAGYKVFGFDVDQKKVDKISKGISPIDEPGMDVLESLVLSEKLEVGLSLREADCFLIAVPTPLKDGKADMSAVLDAATKIASVLKPGNLVIVESTVIVGTTKKVANILEEKTGLKLGIDFYVAYCPERVLPGFAIKEIVNNDRIVGGTCDGASRLAKDFYSRFVKGDIEIVDSKTAEIVKLVENSYRNVQIAFANEVSLFCESMDVNPFQVIALANRHPRVSILSPGSGVGGHCIAVDPWFLIEAFPRHSNLIRMAHLVNDYKPEFVVNKIITLAKDFFLKKEKKVKVTLFGLTFKANVDDIRLSPSLKIARILKDFTDYLELQVYDSFVANKYGLNNEFKFAPSLKQGIQSADIVVFLVQHSEFFGINLNWLKDKVIVDVCGVEYFLREGKKTRLFKTDVNCGKGVREVNL